MVVVAERDRYCLLITAFYFDHEHSLRKKLKKYEEFIKAKNASLESETFSETPSTTGG